ncbi:hypothetical protein VNO78_08347 [Psophocarpus tetragonolobus]|uniref:Laccase n=1 Tax=Psophocarpus tetragonolobus TaxID=3891 RepID=A0AAN9XSI9_PSOTE
MVGQMDQLISRCSIQLGSSYTYDFNVTGQRATLWWHAHILWLRATVYGAIVISPKPGTPFPFIQPAREFEVVLGEWWNKDVEEIEKQGNKMRLPPNTHAMEVEPGKTYLLRIINAALNDELFFAIADHNLTVVEVDAIYTKPFTIQAVLIAGSQTTNVLVHANQFAVAGYTRFALSYNKKLRSLNSAQYHANVPFKVVRNLFYTVDLVLSHIFMATTFLLLELGPVILILAKYNLADPIKRNTVEVSAGGWTAIRFRADNPGVWFMHCHLELHTGWGLKTAYRLGVENGFCCGK